MLGSSADNGYTYKLKIHAYIYIYTDIGVLRQKEAMSARVPVSDS